MRRLRVLLLFAFTGCAHTVTEPNPPSPPAKLDVPYAGRIVLSTPELRDRVDSFASPWIRRLEILGLTAQITYDDDRAVFDVYGTDETSLAGIAAALADPASAFLEDDPIDGTLLRWLPPMQGCECSGRAEVRLDVDQMCNLLNRTEFRLVRLGLEARLRGRVIVRPPTPDPKERGVPLVLCPQNGERGYFPHSVLLDLPPASNPTQIVLALGGGSLPVRPRVDSVQASRGAP